eukprot:GHVL01037144.1.p1 GENE.GHVL01037144.1~~GHVL01037144.1.p1  ORF type:complete len:197 (+),score=28.75 GHVL01037144.1:587-1177(+)
MKKYSDVSKVVKEPPKTEKILGSVKIIEELFKVDNALGTIFRAAQKNTDQFVTPEIIKEVVENVRQLPSGDALMASQLAYSIDDELSIKAVCKRAKNHLLPFYRVYLEGATKEPVIFPGPLNKVRIYRKGRRTNISYLHQYGLDIDNFCHVLSREFACASFVKKDNEIILSGNFVDKVASFLIKNWGLPQSRIRVG